MKGKIYSLSVASFLLLAAAGSVYAQECTPLLLNRSGVPNKPFRYTVNYAVSNPMPVDPALGTDGTETAIHIINRYPYSQYNGRLGCIYVLFKDKNGIIQGIAQGMIPSHGSRVFATSYIANKGNPPPFVVDYPALAADTSNPAQVLPDSEMSTMQVPFEGRAEIYAINPLLQVAPFAIGSNGTMTDIPMQRSTTPTTGTH